QRGHQADSHQVRRDRHAGQRKRYVVVDRLLHGVQQRRRGSRSEAVHVAVERSGQAGKDDVLNAGYLEEIESQRRFVGAIAPLQLLLDSVAVIVVALVITAAYDSVIVGYQEGSERRLRVGDGTAPLVEDT